MNALMDRIIGLRQALTQTGAAVPEGDQLRKQISDSTGKSMRCERNCRHDGGGAITGEDACREHTDQLYGSNS